MNFKNAMVLGAAALPLWGCVATPEYQTNERDYRRPEVTVIEQHRYPVQSAPSAGSIDSVQEQQRRRIEAGVRSGELTREEAKRLEAEQAAIRKEELAYKADGRLTERERAELKREQLEAERNIRREATDAQDADKRRRD